MVCLEPFSHIAPLSILFNYTVNGLIMLLNVSLVLPSVPQQHTSAYTFLFTGDTNHHCVKSK